ncbi:MAG: sulfatase family protein [Planctomycetota bacterium]
MKKYNLLILTPDQYRADYIGCYGHPTIGTSHIDRLAEEGIRFSRCYCAAPLCGPSRISFATSLRFSEHGRRDYESCIDYAVPNLVRSMKEAGCRTGMFGKNHLFLYDQLEQAWDELHEICLGNYDEHPRYKRSYSAFALAHDHPYNLTARLADEAIDFIRRNPADRPFLCCVNWQDPHPAYTCPEPYASMFDPADVSLPPNWCRQTQGKPGRLENWRINSLAHQCTEDEARRAIAMYMGQCRCVDDQVGRIMRFLEESGQIENTVVVFCGDHGEFIGDFGVFHKLPLFYECLARIPVIIRHPGNMVHPFVFDGLVEQVDLAPTLLEMLGIQIPQSMVGTSLHAQILRGDGSGRDSVLVEAGLQMPTSPGPVPGANHRAPYSPNSHGPGAMVSDGRYKLCMYSDDRHELYDLRNDPHEMDNLYGQVEHSEVQQRLTELLVRRTLGVGIRPDGDWRGPGRDLRTGPPESRESAWQKPELFKGPIHRDCRSQKGQRRPVVEIRETRKRADTTDGTRRDK